MRAQAIVFAVCVVACIAAEVAILRSVVRARTGPSDPGVPRPLLLVEIVWALVPAIALALVLTATWGRIQERHGAPAPRLLMRVAK
jgi:heme/copper-type cytochrome/quinol oxidase subunit 2